MVPNYLSSLQINKLIIIGGSGIGKTNSLFNQTSKQPDIEKIYLYAKYETNYEAKYPLLIDRWESTSLKQSQDTKPWIPFEFPNYLDNIYKNAEEYSPYKECK